MDGYLHWLAGEGAFFGEIIGPPACNEFALFAAWSMNSWLKNNPYRVNLHQWVFALTGALSFLIALDTISYQPIKAAAENPVKSLWAE